MIKKGVLIFGIIGAAFGFTFAGDVKSIIFGFFIGFVFGILIKRAL